MESRKNRIISALLTLCMIIGCLGVLPISIPVSAATVQAQGYHATLGTATDSAVTQVVLNRDFEDGTVVTNGVSKAGATFADAVTLEKADGNTRVKFTNMGNHDYIQVPLGTFAPASGSVVMQFDLMVDSTTAHLPSIIQLNPKVRGSSSDVYIIGQVLNSSGSSFRPLNTKSDSKINANQWYTITYVWTYTSVESVTVTCFSGTTSSVYQYVDNATPDTGCTDVRPGEVRMGITSGANASWYMDNLLVYTTAETDPYKAAKHTIASSYKGAAFNTNAELYVDPNAFKGNHFLKLGATTALTANDEKVELTVAPFKHEEKIYIPYTTILKLGFTSSQIPTSKTSIINGVRSVDLDNMYSITGYYGISSSMGLIMLTKTEGLFIDGIEKNFVTVMKKFLFDNINPDLTLANKFSIDSMVSLDHPYIYADQAKFDELYAEYQNPTDETLYSYIDAHAKSALSTYNGYAKVTNGAYAGLKNTSIAKMPYTDNGGYGYDVGGRQGDSTSHAERILTLAFGYQLTRNEDFARLAYDYAIALGQWEHWGPGHFLNVADASAPYAVAYDWLYDVWVELGLDVTAVETILFTHMILPAYYSKHDNGCPWYDPVVASGWNYHSRTNNWNAVCSAGVTMASLALIGLETEVAGTKLDIEIDGVYNPVIDSYAGTSGTITRKDGKSFKTDSTGMDTYRDFCIYLINGCLYDLPYYGMGQYVPDGSYIESNGYWSYGTNNFYETVAAIVSTTGTDWGLLDCWGIDRTNYFALNTMSGDYQSWNYHDSGSVGAQDTSWFLYLGTEYGLGDKTLAGIRKHIIKDGGSTSSKYDILYYMTDEEIGEWHMPDIQYHMEGIHGYAVRDSWDRGSIFAGIMGEANNVTHGQIDSGAFIYYSNGVRWFCDVGTENYNAYQFWGNGRHAYYKMNAEGNNTLVLTSRQDMLPFGQLPTGFGYMIETFDNDHGAYSIIDNTSVYSSYALKAYRGMLFTNDRKTLVIQDEVEFATEESAVWVGHTMSEVIISLDGKTAYMYDSAKAKALKVTLLDENDLGLKFEVTDTYDFLLDATVGPTYSTDNGGQPEGDRSAYKRLLIRANNVKSLKLAVVIEEVAIGETLNDDIGYEWCDMKNWVPTADGRAENKELGSFDFDGSDMGSISCEGNLAVDLTVVGTHNAASIGFANAEDDGSVSFTAKENKVAYGSLGQGFVTAEFDLSTLSALPANVSVGLAGKGGYISSVKLSELASIAASKWVRGTIVLDLGSCTAYYFIDNSLVSYGSYPLHSCENLALCFTSAGVGDGSILVDNVRIRVFTDSYTALDSALADSNLSLWKDATEAQRCTEGSVAVAQIISLVSEGDTPIVDILCGTTSYTAVQSGGIMREKIVEVYSFDQLEELLYDGAYVRLLTDNKFTNVNVTVPCTVDTQGYAFKATSESYISRIESDLIHFEEGEVQVKWVVGSTTYKETYTGTVTATYKKTLPTTLYEGINDDGTYRYFTKQSWSNTNGGAALTAEEMTVTTENCTFYQAEKSYEGDFVVVKNGVVTGYQSINSLFTSAILNGGYDRVSLTRDCSYDSSSITDSMGITANFNLYLNGYTLTYNTEDSSDHMFNPWSKTNRVSFYGPGTIDSLTNLANIIYQNGNFYAEDVTFKSVRAITDARSDLGHYKNCDIIITKNSSAMGVLNRNNAITDTARMPKLLVEGCNVRIEQSSTATVAFSINCNSSIELTGGTSVYILNGGAALFRLQANTIGTVEGFDYASSFANMKAIIGDISYNTPAIYSCETNDPSGNTYDMSGKVFYGDGASFETPPTSAILPDLVVVRTDNTAKPYIVTSLDKAAVVDWFIGDESYSEFWLDGTVPRPDSPEVKEFIARHTASSGNKLTFHTEKVSGLNAYAFYAVEIKAFDILMNLTLESDFTFNVYVPMNIDGIEIVGYTVDGVSYSITSAAQTSFDGNTFYKIKKTGIAPSSAAEEVQIGLTVKYNGEQTVINLASSITDYASRILKSSSQSAETKSLMANVLKYVKSAYEYTESITNQAYIALCDVYDSYSSLACASVVKREAKDLSVIADGIKSANLNLCETPNFRFNIREGYCGTVTLTYRVTDNKGNSEVITSTYEISDGLYDGLTYIELERRAYDMADEIIITTEGGNASYSLAAYYHAQATEFGTLTNLLNALYAYCETAKTYVDSLG